MSIVHLFLVALPLLIIFLFLLPQIRKNGGKLPPPPGPPGLPFIGNLHQLDISNFHEYLRRLSEKYGPVMSLRLGSIPTVVISSARLAKEVLKTQDPIFCSRPALRGPNTLSYNGSDVATARYGDYWREMKKMCGLHLFSAKRVQYFRPIHEDEVLRTIKGANCKEHLRHNIHFNTPQTVRDDFIDILLQLRNDKMLKSFDLTLDHIKGVLMNIFLGGTETMGATLVWAMTELMKQPRVMTKVQEEVRNLVGNKGFVDADDLPKLPYLKAVVKEAMRLYPAIPLLLPRETMAKSILDGYEIQPKTQVYINAWAIGRDPEAWEKPEEYWPERFEGSSIDFKGQDFELIPFGAGRRGCPAVLMGAMTVELALSNFLYSFNWKLPVGMQKEDIDYDCYTGVAMIKKNDLCLLAEIYEHGQVTD